MLPTTDPTAEPEAALWPSSSPFLLPVQSQSCPHRDPAADTPVHSTLGALLATADPEAALSLSSSPALSPAFCPACPRTFWSHTHPCPWKQACQQWDQWGMGSRHVMRTQPPLTEIRQSHQLGDQAREGLLSAETNLCQQEKVFAPLNTHTAMQGHTNHKESGKHALLKAISKAPVTGS